VSDDTLSSRRALRVPARCAVRAQADSSAWSASTADVGPDGCRLVGDRQLQSGQSIRLQITSPNVRRVLEATGRVAWASSERPFTCGVAFDEAVRAFSHPWFDAVVEDDPELLLEGDTPDQLGPASRVYLGQPPAQAGRPGLTADELEVLRLVGAGATIGELRTRLSATWARSRRVLLGLLSRRLLTIGPDEGAGAEAWEALLRGPAAAAALVRAGAATPARPAPRRSAEAQEAFEQGRKALADGRLGSARTLLSHAAMLAPGDREIGAALDRAMWGISG
jgi:hypothetical protein